MWKLTPWPLHSNTDHPPLLLGLKLLFPVLLEKQKCLEHGKSSWEKQKLDNIQFSSNTLWVTSLVETMDIQSIRQVGNTALLYFFKSSKLVDDTSFRGAQLEKHLFISDDICEFTCAQMCKAHSLSLCSDNVINSPCPGSAAICYGPIVTQGLPLPVFLKKDLKLVYWHSWNEGICQTRSQELAHASTRPSYNPVQITPVVSLKQGNKCTTYCISSDGKALDVTCKSQTRSHQAPCHQLPLNQAPWPPQNKRRKKAPLPKPACGQLQRNTQPGCPWCWPASQPTETRRRTEQWSSQQVVQAVTSSDTLTPSENKFNIIFIFLLYLASQTPNGETAMRAASHVIQRVCGSQTLVVTGTKGTKRGVFYSEEISHQSWQGTKLSFGGHTVLCKQPGCSCWPVNAECCTVTE